MFNNVVVGFDGQPGGFDAIALATELIDSQGKLAIAHVRAGDPGFARGANLAFDEAERKRSHALLETAHLDEEVDARRLALASSSAGRGLHELAERQAADLLVVGSCRRGLMGRVFIGDDTRDELNGAPCAVAIAPAGYAEHSSVFREIGVGHDGSPESDRALDVARQLAVAHRSKVSAFAAVSIPAGFFASGLGTLATAIPDYVEQARNRLVALGDVEPHAAYGVAAEELALYSASLDLLIVGSRGYGPIGRLIHGSTSQRLARTARCPLLVLPRGVRAGESADLAENGRHAVAAGPA